MNSWLLGGSGDEDYNNNNNNINNNGVRDDLTEIKETFTRQFRGVADFLAPRPSKIGINNISQNSEKGEKNIQDGVFCEKNSQNGDYRGDFANNGNYEDEYENSENEAIGITEEVLNFAMNIAHHPETWLDFPLDEEDDDDDEQNALDFDMSDEQQKHVMAIQCLAPRLAALRIELCPAHMSDGYFWKVYFVLLHSRLNKQDAELLSTPQTLAARGIWIKELQKRNKREMDRSPRSSSDAIDSPSKWLESFGHGKSVLGRTSYSLNTEPETVKHPIVSTEIQVVDKAVIEEEPLVTDERRDFRAGPSFKPFSCNFEEDEDDDWLKEDAELEGYNTAATFVGNEDDVSFSDLEDDDFDCTMPIKSKIVTVDLGTPKKAL